MTFGSSILLFDHITLNAGSIDTHTFNTTRIAQLSEYFRIIFVANQYNNALGVDPAYIPQIKLRIIAECTSGDAYEYCLYPVNIDGAGFKQDIRLRSGEYTRFTFSIINDSSQQLIISDIQFCPESREEDMTTVLSSAQDMVDELAANISLNVHQYSDSGGQTYVEIVLNVGEERFTGTAVISGNLQVSGQLSAQELYAAVGDLADLTVDHLSSTRRIAKYLAKDQTDNNYIDIADEQLRFISGVYTAYTEQATDPYGAALYWESQVWQVEGQSFIPGVILGPDGFPYYQGVRIYTTTTPTAYPVMVYVYDELVKASIAYENDGQDYIPVLTMGAGNTGEPTGNNIFKLRKARNGLELLYKAVTGREIGLKGTVDGFLDPIGFREVTLLDFSRYSAGEVTVEVEGGVEYTYTITFDAQGIPTRIKRKNGEVVVVT